MMGPKAKLRALYAIIQPLAVRIDRQISEMPDDPPGQSAPEDGREAWSLGRTFFEATNAKLGESPSWDDLSVTERDALEAGAAAVLVYSPLVVVREPADIGRATKPVSDDGLLDITPMAAACRRKEAPDTDRERVAKAFVAGARHLSTTSSEYAAADDLLEVLDRRYSRRVEDE